MKMTSAYANKLLKSLTDEKSYWEAKEAASRTYVAAVGEEPVIPEYDYTDVSATLKEIDRYAEMSSENEGIFSCIQLQKCRS